MEPAPFIPNVSDALIRREKARARELRQSAWWKRRIGSGVCHYCERPVGARALTMDHLIPLIRGGRSIRANLVPACKDCNSKKQSLLPWEWDAHVPPAARTDADSEPVKDSARGNPVGGCGGGAASAPPHSN